MSVNWLKPHWTKHGEDQVSALHPNVRQLERRHDGGVVAIGAGGAYGTGTRMLTLDELCARLNITERHARKLVEREAAAIAFRSSSRRAPPR